MKKAYIGIDIGGTKCAVIKGILEEGKMRIERRIAFPTVSVKETLGRILEEARNMLPATAVGISCGGPLDENRGVILSPPNLPDWDEIYICKLLEEALGIPAALRNDANACALAEWKFGAGVGVNNMVFLTFGTGLGAGIIADGRLYSGANGNAGEVGHIRLSDDGPTGYGKRGSFEGFCSGGGIAQLGRRRASLALSEGKEIFGCKCAADIEKLDTKTLSILARGGDGEAAAVFSESGKRLGEGLAKIIDTLNPERIVIGSVFARCEELLRPAMEESLNREALGISLGACEILPAKLGEEIGDYAALGVAMECKQSYTKSDKYPYIDEMVARYPSLSVCAEEVKGAVFAILESYYGGGKLLLCGNGGSCADCDHISGELLKGFLKKRPPIGEVREALVEAIGEDGARLQGGIPAIPLTQLSSVMTAFNNDVDPKLCYAQLVYSLGRAGDVLIALSTSGNSEMCTLAAMAARALGIKVISLTGRDGGRLAPIADIAIKVPESETFKVQELHLPTYHAICAEVEEKIFPV